MTRQEAAQAMLGFFDQRTGCKSETANSDELYQLLYTEAVNCNGLAEFDAVCDDVIRWIEAVKNGYKGEPK